MLYYPGFVRAIALTYKYIAPDGAIVLNHFDLLKFKIILFELISKLTKTVIPAKAGIQNALKILDSDFHRNDADGLLQLAHFK